MLEQVPLWLVIVLLFGAMAAAYEAGMVLHGRLRRRADAGKLSSSDESYAMSGVFGLLALLMAFSFGLALNRYEERRNLVTEEANALDSFASRLALLAEADRVALRRDLSAYAAARVEVGTSESVEAITPALARAETLLARLDKDLYAVLSRLPADARTTLLAQAFDQLGDVATQRKAARSAHLPGLVLALLALYCVIGAFMLGYTVAGAQARHRAVAGVFFLLLAFAFTTVLDLDRPRGGIIIVPQHEMTEIVRRLAA